MPGWVSPVSRPVYVLEEHLQVRSHKCRASSATQSMPCHRKCQFACTIRQAVTHSCSRRRFCSTPSSVAGAASCLPSSPGSCKGCLAAAEATPAKAKAPSSSKAAGLIAMCYLLRPADACKDFTRGAAACGLIVADRQLHLRLALAVAAVHACIRWRIIAPCDGHPHPCSITLFDRLICIAGEQTTATHGPGLSDGNRPLAYADPPAASKPRDPTVRHLLLPASSEKRGVG